MNCQICNKEAKYSTFVYNHETKLAKRMFLCEDCFLSQKHIAVKIDNTDVAKDDYACMCSHKANAEIRSKKNHIIYVKFHDVDCIDMSTIDDTILIYFEAQEEHISLRHKYYTFYLRE